MLSRGACDSTPVLGNLAEEKTLAAVSIQVSPGAHESQTIRAVDGALTINTRFEFQPAWRAEGAQLSAISSSLSEAKSVLVGG